MPTMESMLRSINRQLEQHKRYFGADSETYKNFVMDLEYDLGKANYVQKNGAVGYSRAIPMQYDFDDVQRAYNKTKGKNTAAYKFSKEMTEAAKEGITDIKQVKKRIRLKEKVEKNFELIYNYLQDEMNENFYKTDFPKGLREAFDDDILTHIMKTTRTKSFDSIERLIDKAEKRAAKVKEEIEAEAKKTRGGKLAPNEKKRLFKKRGKK